jgi:hypothetical protein
MDIARTEPRKTIGENEFGYIPFGKWSEGSPKN